MPYGADAFPTMYLRDMEERGEEELEREATMMRRLAEVPVTTVLREGRAQYEIVELLERRPLVRPRGRRQSRPHGLKRALIGSVAEAVVRHARVPGPRRALTA